MLLAKAAEGRECCLEMVLLSGSCRRPVLPACHSLFDPCGRAEHRWGEEEFLAERTGVCLLTSWLQTEIHFAALKQPGHGCVVHLETQSCFWFTGGALHRLSPFSAML